MNTSVEKLQVQFNEALETYRFFDFNFWNAPCDIERFYPAPTYKAALNSIMQFCKSGALITNSAAANIDPIIGNRQLSDILQTKNNSHSVCCPDSNSYRHLRGCLLMTPDPALEGDLLETYLNQMTASGFAAVRYMPLKFYHSLSETVIGEQLHCFEKRGLPLLISHSETSWDAIDSLCTRHPNLNVVVDGGNAKIVYRNRDYIAQLRKHEHLFIETRSLVLTGEIEALCSLVGAEKLIFGTYAVYNNPAIPISSIAFANISEREKCLIAHGNAMRLLNIQ